MQKDVKERRQMFLMIEQWKASGQSQMAYCKEVGMSYHIFHYWYKVYRDEHNKNTHPTAAFIELQVSATQQTTTMVLTTTNVELLLPDGKRLLFHGSVEASFLRSLLQ